MSDVFHDQILTKRAEPLEELSPFLQWMAKPDMLEKLPELKGKVLGCWCAPEACHGDLLSELTNGTLS